MKQIRLILMACVTALSVANASTLTNGLIAQYAFEGNCDDGSGNNNHAATAGSFQFLTNGLTGVSFRGNGDNGLFYADGGHVALPNLGSNLNAGFSVNIWVKDEVIGGFPVNEECYFQFTAIDNSQAAILLRNTGNPHVLCYMNDGINSGPEIEVPIVPATFFQKWKMLTLTYVPGTLTFYIDGVKKGTRVANFMVFPTKTAVINRHYWDSGSSARISATYDNLRIYSRELLEGEVKEIFNIEGPNPQLSINIAAVKIQWFAKSNVEYQVQWTTNFQAWSPLTNVLGAGAETNVVDWVDGPGRSYRVQLPQ